ncbi:thiol-disulfide isomerase/thioredoxin [Symbiobacterium terraclitae]|uniref:Thiol-disulfide isomerase/thioredoxin n=1 Tax=Symbiobacterium terraclitae TaxID=557451 RepID=A0ABS4JR64_9FIRM|nr:redoxin domain-containing protein [Symbiobacterium terraclitae]MBP2018022.1 thiol-disulfide isomerase/thioredoxin [Symbiobacterium terraclitae]
MQRAAGAAVLLIWAAVLLGGAFRPQGSTPVGPEHPYVGHAAPALALADPSGRPVSLADLRGRAVFLNFWASWCGPCRAEMPEIQRLAESLPDGAAILTVNVTAQERSPEAALAYLREHGYTFPVALDPTGAASDRYQVASLPTSLFISPEGAVTARVAGPLTLRAMQGYLSEAQAGPPRTAGLPGPGSLLPEALSLGPAVLPTRALFWSAGALAAYLAAGQTGRELVFNLALGSLLGAKLIYVLLDPAAYLRSPGLLLGFPHGTQALPGALIGGLALAFWGLRRTADRLPAWDRAAPALLCGAGLGMLGSPGPADWVYGPLLLAAGVAALALARAMPRAGDATAMALTLGGLAVVLADLARPAASPAGVSALQVAAGLAATAAWLWRRRRPERA